MSINITDGFNINFAAPVDYRMVTANSTTRLAIAYKYDGLKVFQLDNRVGYIWNSGGSGNWDIENSDKISGSGTTNYIPKFTSSSQIGASSIYVNGDKVGIATNDPKEYMQIGSFPVAYPGQSLPLTIHKGNSATIGYNWYYDGGVQSFTSSVGSSTITFGGGEIQFENKEAYSSFKTSLYLKSNGNVLIGTNTSTQISGSSSMFTNAFPKLDIITGESSGSYQELMTLRHNMDSSVVLRRLGYIMKMSDESTLVESNKMGGMILESLSGYADYPSLHLVTDNQKRLSISSVGNVVIGTNSNTSIYSGSSLFNSSTPKLEVLAGTSSVNYQELMVLRGLKGNFDNTSTRLGVIMKLSDENDANESNKMGGMILESTTGYSNYPSLYLATGNQKRLRIDDSGNIYATNSTSGAATYSISGNKMVISLNDIYTDIHNKGTNGIGDSGNTTYTPDGEGGGSGPWLYPSISSGTFTSIISNASNLTSLSLIGPVSWMRVGNVVSVSGQVEFTVTSSSTPSTFYMTLPIKSYFGDYTINCPLNGVGKIVGKTGGGDVAAIRAEYSAFRDVAEFLFTPSTTGDQKMCFSYQYSVGTLTD